MSQHAKILIVEDHFVEANHLQGILEGAGYSVCSIAHSVAQALDIIDDEKPDFVLIDIFLKGTLTGIDLARILRERNLPFVYLSANANKTILDEAKATQPYGFLVKPFREKDVLVSLEIAHYLHEHSLEARLRRQELYSSTGISTDTIHDKEAIETGKATDLVGQSGAFKHALHLAQAVAPADTSVLILGESGTGKEKLANFIHERSNRRHKPMIRINCGTLPFHLIESELFGHERGAFTGATEKRTGKFEQAEGGTIFLDEVADIPFELQSKLLRVLQEKEIDPIGRRTPLKVNVRIIASTNRNLEKEVADGRFRIDLYYRLNVFPIRIPPLRERPEDILPLASHFIQYYARRAGKKAPQLSEPARQAIVNAAWPGNIRELENRIERSILLAQKDIITPADIHTAPYEPGPGSTNNGALKTLEENERHHIVTALARCNGKVSGQNGAARLLGLNVSTLNARIRKLGIDKKKNQ